MNCKPVPVVTGPSSFLLQPNFIWLVVLSNNYRIYDFNDTRSNFFLIFVIIFVLLVTFELISHYPNIDSSHWLTHYIELITDKVFREKLMV